LATIAADGPVLDTWFLVPELGARGPWGTSRLLAAEVLPTWPGWARDYPTRAIFFEYSRTGREIERLCLAGQK
jgi:hypothetical protein